MANVQAENGYTKIANELLEIVMQQKFNGTQFKIIMALWRFTYGFNRKKHEMSLSFLSKATGLHKQRIKNDLDKLIEQKVILVVSESSFTSSRELSFNKNYDEWTCLQLAKPITVSESADSTVSESDYTTVSESAYQERNIKENIKENIKGDIPFKKIIDYLNQKTGKKYNHKSSGNQKVIKARWNEGYIYEDFVEVINHCCDEWKGKTFSNGAKGDDYLRPSTLFNNKFDERLNRATAAKNVYVEEYQEDRNVVSSFNGSLF